MDFKQVKKKLNIDNSDIAKMFGYKSANSFGNSSKRPYIERAVVEIYEKTIEKIKNCLE